MLPPRLLALQHLARHGRQRLVVRLGADLVRLQRVVNGLVVVFERQVRLREIVEGFEVLAAWCARFFARHVRAATRGGGRGGGGGGCGGGKGGKTETFLAVFDYRVPAGHFEARHGAVGVEEGVGGVGEDSVIKRRRGVGF